MSNRILLKIQSRFKDCSTIVIMSFPFASLSKNWSLYHKKQIIQYLLELWQTDVTQPTDVSTDPVYSNENLSCRPNNLNEETSNAEGLWSSISFHWWIFPSSVAAFSIENSSPAIIWVVVQKQRWIFSAFEPFGGYWIGITDIEPPNLP